MSSTIAAAQVARQPRTFGLWIDGKSKPAASGRVFHRKSPFDGSIAATFANGADEDARAAITAARATFDAGRWPRSSARARFELLMRAARLMTDRAHEFASSMATESGKPVRVGLGEVGTAIRTFEYYAAAALDLQDEAIGHRVEDALGLILREPIGVAGLITPWNFPILNPVVKIAPALAMGCTLVIKPSHLCSGPVLLLAEILSEAGLPDGAFNVVTSDIDRGAVVGQAIAASPLIEKVAFTGSTATGRAVMATAAGTNKRVSMELGGKSANIVFADADLEDAAAVSVGAFCFNSGQQCSAGTRLLLQDSIHDRFLALLARNAGQQKLGDPLSDATTMGPIVNEDQLQRVRSFIEIGRQEADLVVGGGAPPEQADGLFVEPTIFDRVANTSRLAQDEIFGPVLSVIPFHTEEDAIRLANETRYGLAGGVWSRSLSTALRVAKAVRTGKMFVNSYNNSGLEDMPHGGYKDSGVGREQGRRGLEEFQEIKSIHIKIGKPSSA